MRLTIPDDDPELVATTIHPNPSFHVFDVYPRRARTNAGIGE